MLHSIVEFGDYVGGFFLLEDISHPYLYLFIVIDSDNNRTIEILLDNSDLNKLLIKFEIIEFFQSDEFFNMPRKNLINLTKFLK